MSPLARVVVLLVLSIATVRVVAAQRGQGSLARRLDDVAQLIFAGVVGYWAHRLYAPYANRFDPGLEPAVFVLGFLVGIFAAYDIFSNALKRQSQHMFAHFAIVVFVALSAATSLASPDGARRMSRSDEAVILELAASRGPTVAPPGVVPPFLEIVSDTPESTVIRNLMDQPLRIRLSRYIGGQHCKMYFDGTGPERGDFDGAFVQAGHTRAYTTSTDVACRYGAQLPPLEFEASVTSSPLMLWQTATLREEAMPSGPEVSASPSMQ